MRKVEAGIERKDLVERLIYNIFIARIKMQNLESVNALLFFGLCSCSSYCCDRRERSCTMILASILLKVRIVLYL